MEINPVNMLYSFKTIMQRAKSEITEEGCRQKRRVKVVAVVWGTEFIQVLARLLFLHQANFKKGMNSSYSSNRPGAK